MKYFKIIRNSDLGVIGHYPQTSLKKEYNPGLPFSHRQVKWNAFPAFSPELELEIDEKAVPTNFLHKIGISFGLVIDRKVKEILEKHSLPPHHFYPIKVYHKNKLLEYYWLHWIIDDFWTFMDTQKSIVNIYHLVSGKKTHDNIPLKSRDQIISLKNKLGFEYRFALEKLVFKPSYPMYDFYEITNIDNLSAIIISEKLKNSLEKAGMTGLEIFLYRPINTHKE